MVINIYVLPHQGSAPEPRWGTLSPFPPVLSPSETNFWLRPWYHVKCESVVTEIKRARLQRIGGAWSSAAVRGCTATDDNVRVCVNMSAA